MVDEFEDDDEEIEYAVNQHRQRKHKILLFRNIG